MRKFKDPGKMMVDGNLVEWVHTLNQAMKKHSPWKQGYNMPDTAIPFMQALLQRQLKETGLEHCETMLVNLVKYRDFCERAICYNFQMDADEIRENSTPEIEYNLGLMDAVIGWAMSEWSGQYQES